MKAIALANRLMRDLKEKSLSDLTADTKLELLDAINGGLQKLHALSTHASRTTVISLCLPAPEAVTIGVTNGSYTTTGTAFTSDQLYRTIKISGDSIDNQISGTNALLHPYGGTTGTVTALIYSDSVAIPQPYAEFVGSIRVLEDGYILSNRKIEYHWRANRPIRRPYCFWVEPNAPNRNSPAPFVVRFDALPDKIYRMEAQASLAPDRISFSDLSASGSDIPLLDEHIESYLLPISRGLLANSEMWRDENTKATAKKEAEAARADYEMLVPKTLGTPNNKVRTKYGF